MQLRVSAVQYDLRTIHSFKEFADQVEHYIKTAEEFGTDFVLFPEFFTTQLMSIGNAEGQVLSIDELPDYTEQYLELFKGLAASTGMHIIGGTHVIKKKGAFIMLLICFIRTDGWQSRQSSTSRRLKFMNGI